MGHGSDMARQLRVEYEGAIYHVMNRGDRRQPIFIDEKDRQVFLERWENVAGRPAGKFTAIV